MNLENIFDSFEESQSDALKIEINNVYDVDDLEILEKRYGKVEHPNIGYLLGQKWSSISYNLKDAAFPHYLNSAAFGFDPKNIWLNTGYANDIAQSMYHLLVKYKYRSTDNPIFLKLAANAFILWSGLINNMKQQAYDSLKFRGFLLNLENMGVRKLLKEYYYDGDDICPEILTIGDFVLATVGYNEVQENDNVNEMHENVNEAHQKILSLPQYSNMMNLSIAQIAQMSFENQKYMFNNVLKDYLNGEFSLDADEFKDKMHELRIEPNPFLSGF